MFVDGQIVFPHLCPVGKKHYFTEPFEDCSVCGWCNDVVQERKPDWKKCGNFMSFNEAIQAYKEGKEIY